MKRARKRNSKRNVSSKPQKKHGFRFATFMKAMLITLGVIVLAVVVGLGFGFFDESDLLAPIDRESGKVNALILGVDDDGLRTDSIMLASFDLDTAEINMLSIPRDTKVVVKNRDVTRRINEVHAMSVKDGSGTIVGPIGTAEAVTQLTGIPINYYVEFNFDAIENIFDTLGTITYDVPDVEGGGRGMNYEDPAQDLYIHLKPGVQELDGDKLLQLMRYRKGDSDYARMERQQSVIKAMVEQRLDLSLIMKIPKMFSQIKRDIVTNISSADVAKYSQYLGELSSDKIHTYQLPGESKKISGVWYHICDTEAANLLISETFGYDTGVTTTVEVHGEGSTAKAKTNNKKKVTGTPSKSAKNTKATAAPGAAKTPKATAKPSQSTSKATAAPKKATPKPDNPDTGSKPTQAPSNTAKPTAQPTQSPTKAPETNENNGVITLD